MSANELHREEGIEGKLLLWAADWLTALLLSVGMIFPCLTAYGLSGRRDFDAGAVMALCVFGSLAATAVFTWRRGYWAALGVLAVEAAAFWRLWVQLREDWQRVRAPELADLFASSTGAMMLLYVLVVLTLGWIVVRVRAWWLAAVLVTAPLLPAIQAGMLPSWGAMLAGFVGWGAMLLTDLFGRRDRGSLARARFLSLGGAAALTLALVMALPRESYLRPQWATDARDGLIRSVNRQLLRFFDPEDLENNLLSQLGLDLTLDGVGMGSGPAVSGGLGDGEAVGTGMKTREDLSSLGPRRYMGRLLMRLHTDQPDPAGRLYLRGASFETYTGSAWEGGDGEALAVPPERFPPETAPGAPVWTMRIQDEAFWGTWYYPYRYAGNGRLDGDGRLTLERGPDAQPLEYPDWVASLEDMPKEEYTVSYRPGGPEDGFLPLEGRWAAEEERYSGGVYGAALEVPHDLRAFLEPLLEEARRLTVEVDARLPEQFRNSVAAAARTAAYLAFAASYDPDTPAMGTEEDFVTRFLTEGRGFCVHFATAGTMLLRMQGVPARYVNGYVAEVNGQGWGTVLDSGAHAWVEIYLDGYGWYPVEMTPGYTGGVSGVGLENASGDPEDPDGEEVPEAAEEEDPEIPDEEESPEESPDRPSPEEEAPEAEEKIPGAFWKALFGIAAAWGVLCAAYLLALWARRRARGEENTNRSVLNAYGRYKRLRRWGCGEDEELERLAKKAKFSQHTLTAEERAAAWSCLDEDVKQSRVGQPRRRRWLLALLCPLF